MAVLVTRVGELGCLHVIMYSFASGLQPTFTTRLTGAQEDFLVRDFRVRVSTLPQLEFTGRHPGPAFGLGIAVEASGRC